MNTENEPVNNPVNKVKDLRKRVSEEAEKLGLAIHNFALIPGDDHEHDIVQVVFTISAEAIESESETEKRQTDEAFEALMGAEFEGSSVNEEQTENEQRIQDQADAARESIEGWFNEL